MKTEVISVTRNTAVILSGNYEISFQKTPAGVRKREFIVHDKSRMRSSYIPHEIFWSAVQRAQAIFHRKGD